LRPKTPGVSSDLRPNAENYIGERGNSKQALLQWANFTSLKDERLDLITGTGDLLLKRIDKKAGPDNVESLLSNIPTDGTGIFNANPRTPRRLEPAT